MPAYPDDSGSGSDYEEEDVVPRGVKKRGRPAKHVLAKRVRHDTIDSDVSLGPNATLYEIVRQGKMAMSSVVDDWIDAYKTDRNGALLDLIQFFIHASGCKGTVTPKMMQEVSEGFQDVIKQMTEQFDEDSGDYPLIATGAHHRKFRSSFCDFVQALVRQCQYEIIYDQFMMDNILTLLTELSNSQVRAFRHTSTLAAMKLMTGLVNVALQLSVSLDNTQRQYDAENNKNISKRASEKLDILMQKRKELEEQQSEIEGMLNGIFKGIFILRYRDFIAEIRALCMDEIGAWMRMFSKVFLTDSYLKYVGWTLHDKQKEVRTKCLNTLIGLYGDNDMTRDLKLFTSRFKDRIVSMTLDKEYDVAVLAIKLLYLILSNCGYDTPVLTSSDCESVYQLVFSCHRPVAVAAAEFLNKQLFMDKDVNPGYTKRGKRRGVNAPVITDLVLFYMESELHEHATYLVDSLWDVAGSMLKDWECMSDMLLEEPANDRDSLDQKQESALVDIMVCSVKQAAEGVPPTGRQGYSKKSASRDRKIAIEDRLKLTEHFTVALPSLLKKFHVDREKVVGLLQIPRYFELECYTTSRREKHLDELLTQLSVVMDKHTEHDVLEEVSRTFSHLCDDEFAIFSKVSIARRAVIDKWAENLRFSLAVFKEAGDNVDDEEVYNVVQNLKRLTHLFMFNDITQWDLYPQANMIIQMQQERSDSIPESMLLEAVKFIYYHLVYSLAGLKKSSTSSGVGSEDPRAAIGLLRKRTAEYLSSCEMLLAKSPYKKIQEESYMSICDLLVMFAPQLASSSPNLKSLVQRASEPLQHSLVDFIREFVFTMPDEDENEDDTAKIDALHQRRSLLAAICKLFVYNMVDLRLAAVVFQQYIRFYSDYGDIIKETISKTRHVNKLGCAQTLALSLKSLFRETVREQGGVLDQSSQEYGHMKELARRFALTFGLDQVKTRDAVAELHKEGIIFALKRDDTAYNESVAPPNLSFLGILVEFSAKLMRQDKRTVVHYLDKHISPHLLSNQDSSWIPLVTYRNSLLQGAGLDDDLRQAPAKSRRGRRKKNIEGELEPPATPISPATPMHQPQTPMTPQPHAQPTMAPQNSIGQPQLTSTVMRGKQQMRMTDDQMEYRPSQTLINTSMPMTPQHSMPPPQEYHHQMGYPMSVPQQSPIQQIGTPQYMQPSTSSGIYQQGASESYQGVVSPMTQPGMQTQSPYYGN
ncbi:cohesin subunit SA-2 isoform X2 [Ciona intestinalis]